MLKNKFLIISGNSFIGSEIVKYFTFKKIPFFFTTRNKKKIANNHYFFDLESILSPEILNLDFNILVFCAGITSVSECNRKKKYSKKINVLLTKKFFLRFRKKKIKIIYFSSDKIKNKKLSDEYFIQKKNMELFLKKNFKSKYIIIRLGKIIYKDMHLFKNWKAQLKKNNKINVYKNFFYKETKLAHLLKFLLKKNNKFRSKIYNIYSNKEKSYEFLAKNFLKNKKNILKKINYLN